MRCINRLLSLSSSLLSGPLLNPQLVLRPLFHRPHKGDETHTVKVSGVRKYCASSTVEMCEEYERDQLLDDGKVMHKESKLSLALSQLAGDFGQESNLWLTRFSSKRFGPVISTGSLKLDLALGIGGLPKGRMVEIYGREASGKTTLALHIIKEAQDLGGYCAYLDVENALDPSLAEAIGVDLENLLISCPHSAENSLSIVDILISSGSVDVIVVDSVAALVPKSELDGMINLDSSESQSRLMTQALRKIHHSLSRSSTLVVFVNQVRMNSRCSYGIKEVNEATCGGNALGFYAAVRLKTSRRCLHHHEDKVTGIGISVNVVKNKLAPATTEACLDISFGRGIRREAEILEMAAKHCIILREGNGYWIKGEFLEDHARAEEFIARNNSLADELVLTLRNHLFQTTK